MAVQVRIPTPLRQLTRNRGEVAVGGSTVREVVAELERHFPGLGSRLIDDQGAIRRYVNLFLNDQDVRFLDELDTPVEDGDRLQVVPAIAGGSETWR